MRLTHVVATLALPLVLAGPAYAAGGGDETTTKPLTTKTSKECKGVQVWDKKTKSCVNPEESSLDQRELGEAVRELAYAGRNEDAQGILRVLNNQESDLALTYWGFTHRRLGDMEQAMVFYTRALDKNPDNLMARSYMGQGLLLSGDKAAAEEQLAEIRARGGAGKWPEVSLALAIESGATYNY